nr:MAG TPA: hypothetical protein [Caudoviricetes sp.]
MNGLHYSKAMQSVIDKWANTAKGAEYFKKK